jgi:beta-phosphoglucomutase
MLRAIIFDMDGVLCDSEPQHMKAFQRVLTEEGLSVTDRDYYDRYLAHDDRGSFEAAFQDGGRPTPESARMKSFLARKARYFDELVREHLVIYPGVDAFIRKAAPRYALALASGARRLEVEYVLKKAKIRDAFSAVVSADEVRYGKPRPEAFEKVVTLLNQTRLADSPAITAAETLVIEDSPRCIQTAKDLGMKTVGMATSYEPQALEGADLVIDTLVGLELETLEKLFE